MENRIGLRKQLKAQRHKRKEEKMSYILCKVNWCTFKCELHLKDYSSVEKI